MMEDPYKVLGLSEEASKEETDRIRELVSEVVHTYHFKPAAEQEKVESLV